MEQNNNQTPLFVNFRPFSKTIAKKLLRQVIKRLQTTNENFNRVFEVKGEIYYLVSVSPKDGLPESFYFKNSYRENIRISTHWSESLLETTKFNIGFVKDSYFKIENEQSFSFNVFGKVLEFQAGIYHQSEQESLVRVSK